MEVSPLGLGCWAIGGPFWRPEGEEMRPVGWGQVSDRESLRAIHRALDLGVDFLDTANNYGTGRSERVLGKALKGRWDSVVLATKFGSLFDEERQLNLERDPGLVIDEPFIREACEGSLSRLGAEVIDLYQFHWGDYSLGRAPEVRDVLEQLVAEGKIRWYGWSTDDPERAKVFAQGEHCTAVQHRLHALYDTPEMLALCEQYDLASVNKQPLMAGFLTGKFHRGYTFSEDDFRSWAIDFEEDRYQEALEKVESLHPVLTADGRTMVQGALGWIWARSERTVPIPGFKSVEQVEENLQAMDHGPLSAEQMEAVQRVLNPA